MQLVRSALGDGIDHAAGGAPVLRRIVRSVHLEIGNRIQAQGIRDTGAPAFLTEEELVVVSAVHGAVVRVAVYAAEIEVLVAVRVGRDARNQ